MGRLTDSCVAAGLLGPHYSERWLIAEAVAGRIPHLRTDSSFLFDVDAVKRALGERAQQINDSGVSMLVANIASSAVEPWQRRNKPHIEFDQRVNTLDETTLDVSLREDETFLRSHGATEARGRGGNICWQPDVTFAAIRPVAGQTLRRIAKLIASGQCVIDPDAKLPDAPVATRPSAKSKSPESTPAETKTDDPRGQPAAVVIREDVIMEAGANDPELRLAKGDIIAVIRPIAAISTQQLVELMAQKKLKIAATDMSGPIRRLKQ